MKEKSLKGLVSFTDLQYKVNQIWKTGKWKIEGLKIKSNGKVVLLIEEV